MARRPTRRLIEELLASYETKLRDAFLASIDDLTNEITLSTVVEYLRQGNIEAAIGAMQIDTAAFTRLQLAYTEAFNAAGMAEAANMPRVRTPDGNRVSFRFGIRNQPAEQWMEQHSSRLITRIVEEQRAVVRTSLADNLSRGANPRTAALDVVGRQDPITGRRKGGVIGLSAPQERYVATARRNLLSNDPDELSHYLTMTRRDKRFDRLVHKAIRDGTPIPKNTIDKMVGRYSDSLLQLRGETISRTETMESLGTARKDAIDQQIAEGKVDPRDIEKIWRAGPPGKNARDQHRQLNGKSVKYNEPFITSTGVAMDRPHDPNAPASEIINCRCWCEYKIDYFASIVRREQERRGGQG